MRYENDGSYYSAVASGICPVCNEYQNLQMMDALAENQQLRDALERIGAWHICETYYPYGAAINMRETARAALAAVRVEER